MNIGKIFGFPSFVASANFNKPKEELVGNKLERQPETDEFTKEIQYLIDKSKTEKLSSFEQERVDNARYFQKRIKEHQKYSKENK